MGILHYVQQHWFQLTVDSLAILNVIAAGTRVMGWTKLSDELGRVELAITTMVQAALQRKQQPIMQGDSDVTKTTTSDNNNSSSSSGTSTDAAK